MISVFNMFDKSDRKTEQMDKDLNKLFQQNKGN